MFTQDIQKTGGFLFLPQSKRDLVLCQPYRRAVMCDQAIIDDVIDDCIEAARSQSQTVT